MLLILWLLGMVSSYTVGGFIHIRLVIAIVVILLRVISGRKGIVMWHEERGSTGDKSPTN